MAERKNKIKVHSLTGRIDDRLMREAFQAVKRNRGAAGVDKVSIAMFVSSHPLAGPGLAWWSMDRAREGISREPLRRSRR